MNKIQAVTIYFLNHSEMDYIRHEVGYHGVTSIVEEHNGDTLFFRVFKGDKRYMDLFTYSTVEYNG